MSPRMAVPPAAFSPQNKQGGRPNTAVRPPRAQYHTRLLNVVNIAPWFYSLPLEPLLWPLYSTGPCCLFSVRCLVAVEHPTARVALPPRLPQHSLLPPPTLWLRLPFVIIQRTDALLSCYRRSCSARYLSPHTRCFISRVVRRFRTDAATKMRTNYEN